MGIRIFTTKMFREAKYSNTLDLAKLITDFKLYKSTGKLPASLVRDVPYSRPESAKFAELRHIHVNFQENWNLKLVQYGRTSNSAIVYCQGRVSKDNYLIIALLENFAHERSKKITFMCDLAELAEGFRKNY